MTSHLEMDKTFRTCPASNYMFKVNNKNIRARCEICSKLTIKILERRYWRRSGIFIVNFEHVSHLVLVFLLLPSSRQITAGWFCLLIFLNFMKKESSIKSYGIFDYFLLTYFYKVLNDQIAS